jgi:hypothetical protein
VGLAILEDRTGDLRPIRISVRRKVTIFAIVHFSVILFFLKKDLLPFMSDQEGASRYKVMDDLIKHVS